MRKDRRRASNDLRRTFTRVQALSLTPIDVKVMAHIVMAYVVIGYVVMAYLAIAISSVLCRSTLARFVDGRVGLVQDGRDE